MPMNIFQELDPDTLGQRLIHDSQKYQGIKNAQDKTSAIRSLSQVYNRTQTYCLRHSHEVQQALHHRFTLAASIVSDRAKIAVIQTEFTSNGNDIDHNIAFLAQKMTESIRDARASLDDNFELDNHSFERIKQAYIKNLNLYKAQIEAIRNALAQVPNQPFEDHLSENILFKVNAKTLDTCQAQVQSYWHRAATVARHRMGKETSALHNQSLAEQYPLFFPSDDPASPPNADLKNDSEKSQAIRDKFKPGKKITLVSNKYHTLSLEEVGGKFILCRKAHIEAKRIREGIKYRYADKTRRKRYHSLRDRLNDTWANRAAYYGDKFLETFKGGPQRHIDREQAQKDYETAAAALVALNGYKPGDKVHTTIPQLAAIFKTQYALQVTGIRTKSATKPFKRMGKNAPNNPPFVRYDKEDNTLTEQSIAANKLYEISIIKVGNEYKLHFEKHYKEIDDVNVFGKPKYTYDNKKFTRTTKKLVYNKEVTRNGTKLKGEIKYSDLNEEQLDRDLQIAINVIERENGWQPNQTLKASKHERVNRILLNRQYNLQGRQGESLDFDRVNVAANKLYEISIIKVGNEYKLHFEKHYKEIDDVNVFGKPKYTYDNKKFTRTTKKLVYNKEVTRNGTKLKGEIKYSDLNEEQLDRELNDAIDVIERENGWQPNQTLKASKHERVNRILLNRQYNLQARQGESLDFDRKNEQVLFEENRVDGPELTQPVTPGRR